MRIVVTGAGGFVGRALIRALGDAHDVVAVDTCLNGQPGIEGDLCDPAVLERAFAPGCDGVVHLATVPGGAAERDPDLAKRVNLDASMALIDAAAKGGMRPRVIFASSIAVFGNPLPAAVDDATPLKPRMLYGAHKAMIEQWVGTQTRRGAIAGLSLRLPGIVARPRGAAGLKSAFMSELFHALKAGEAITLPVSPEATMWLMSVAQVAANLVHALLIDGVGTMTLPAQRVTMAGLVSVIERATLADPALVTYRTDAELEAGFGRQPPLSTPCAEALGFCADAGIEALVASALAALD